jgi:hypothetical protein
MIIHENMTYKKIILRLPGLLESVDLGVLE